MKNNRKVKYIALCVVVLIILCSIFVFSNEERIARIDDYQIDSAKITLISSNFKRDNQEIVVSRGEVLDELITYYKQIENVALHNIETARLEERPISTYLRPLEIPRIKIEYYEFDEIKLEIYIDEKVFFSKRLGGNYIPSLEFSIKDIYDYVNSLFQ